MPPNTTKQRKKQKRKDVFSASRFEQDESVESESETSSGTGTEGKKVRFRHPRSSTRRPNPNPSLFARFPPLVPSIILGVLSVSIVLAGFSLSFSLSHRVARVIELSKPFFNQFSPALLLSPRAQHSRQIPTHIADYVNKAIIAALQSTAEREDFASSRAIIVPSLTTSADDEWDDHPTHDPDNVLTSNLDENSCWFFATGHGQVAIRVSQLIRLTHVTIDYLPPRRTLAHHAPRRIVVWGLVDGAANRASYQRLQAYREAHQRLGDGPAQSGAYTFLPLANFTYEISTGFPIQTFPSSSAVVKSGLSSGLFVVEIQSNWGGDSTGICRVRLHGEHGS